MRRTFLCLLPFTFALFGTTAEAGRIKSLPTRPPQADPAETVETLHFGRGLVDPPPLWAKHGRREPFLGMPSDPDMLPAFAPFDTQVDWSQYPASASVSVAADFGSPGLASCSGALIDAYHVLTAAHCIHQKDMGGFANGAHVTSGLNHGNAVGAWILQGWTKQQRWGYDIAVLRLDRPVGALVGWYGFGEASCWDATHSDYYVYSFPMTGPYAGSQVFTYGGMEACSGTHQVSTSDAFFEGQSGGVLYELDGGMPVAEAVISHRKTVLYGTDAVRIWGGAFDRIASYIDDYRPDDPDLVPIGMVPERTTVVPELDPELDVHFAVYNHSDHDWTGWVMADLVLGSPGDDPVFRSSSRRVGRVEQLVTLPAQGGMWLQGTATLDNDVLDPFEQFVKVGVVLDTPNSRSSNDVLLNSLTNPLLAIEHADHDLEVELLVPHHHYTTNDPLSFDVVLSNDGAVETGFVQAALYVSETPWVTDYSVHVGNGWAPSVDAESVAYEHGTVPLTSSGSGTHRLVGVFSLPDGTQITSASDPFEIEYQPPGFVGTPPNLRLDYAGFPGGVYEAGDALPVAFQVTNNGDQSSPTWTADFFAARSGDLFGDVVLLAQGAGPEVSGGDSFANLVHVDLSDLPPGEWHLAMGVDSSNDAVPTDNFTVSAHTFTIPVGGLTQ